ncbi:MAG: transglutaminase family protein [Planctomycetota bacterium]|nr:transglutaminase family protein [Planctomycetota bacterium]
MRYRIRHSTCYVYTEPVSLCHNEVCLRPRNAARQKCHQIELDVSPPPDTMARRADYFGNQIEFFTVQERHKRLEVTCQSEVTVEPFAPPMASLTPPWEDVAETMRGNDACRHLEAVQFVYESTYVRYHEQLAQYALQSFPARRPVIEGALDLMHRIFKDFKYDTRATNVMTPIAEVFDLRRGVCQDFAHLMLGCLRSLGLPARYVSGYLQTTPVADQERLIGADASHAWVSVYCPSFGWVDFDPTNDTIPSDKHILVAWGRDYADVSPIKGVILGGGQHSLKVAVSVTPIN